MRIAYLEDDPDQAALIKRWLESGGHQCHHYDRGHALQRALAQESFDVFVLDWHLPDTDGLQVMKEIRSRAPQAVVIFVTARDRDDDLAKVLAAGADDFIGKPVRRAELLARIDARAKRVQPLQGPVTVAPFMLDRAARTLSRDGKTLTLTDKEYQLAEFFFTNLGQLLSRKHLLEAVWGLRADVKTRTLDTHMSRLRSKLGLQEGTLRLQSVQQFGYRLERVEAED
jgi:two-component system, OmpR family, response regulator RegX3